MTPPLPIDAILPILVATLQRRSSAVLTAPPGAGKTTRVPPALLDRCVPEMQQVIVLQPRRVAARATARRMAEERGGALGEEVGYQVRFERRASDRTRILVVTEGVLIRRLLDDPFLEGVGAVVLDEFHERHLDTDLALAMVRRVQETVRPELKLVVMSATLTADRLQRYLGEAPLVECPYRPFPVTVEYVPHVDDTPLPLRVSAAVRAMMDRSDGDLLAFLPGVGEILRAKADLERDAQQAGWSLLPLYGDLSAEEQDRVFQPCAQRKIVLATNVAETSITIPGITTVVDSGVARMLEFDAATGLNRLVLRPISQAAADQRAGRAGRTGPGRCLRLWPEAAQRVRPLSETPELQRVDLAGVVLQLWGWGETDMLSFPWFEAPPEAMVVQAENLLRALDAVDDAGITALGRRLLRLPVHPRLSRVVVEGQRQGHLPEAALAAALISERTPFQRQDSRRSAVHVSFSDVVDRVECLQEHFRSGRTDFEVGVIHRDGARFVRQAAQQLERLSGENAGPSTGTAEALGRAILAGFPDRLVKRREPKSRKGLMVGGRGVRLSDASAVSEAEYYVAVDVDSSGTEALVRLAAGVQRDWLPAEHLNTTTTVEFDASSERVHARRRTLWMDLPLEESPAALPEPEIVAAALASAAREHWSRVFPPNDPEVVNFVARVQSLREWLPDLELPNWDEAALQNCLVDVAFGSRSFAELRDGPWLHVLRARLTPTQLQAVEREAPERMQVPSGSRIAIQYEAGKSPVLAVRIQEIFGWTETPRIARSRVPLLLHLLAPNHRPQQITDDLRSFWTTAYPQIRSELRRRYPKHAWPDDPWTATAERRPQRKPS